MKIKNVKNLAILFLLPTSVLAGSVEVSLDNYSGESSYSVKAPAQKLESKLIFPYEFQKVSLDFKKDTSIGAFSLKVSLPINESKEIGEDYDWADNALTVYSSSKNKLNNYSLIEGSWDYKFTNDWELSNSVSYEYFNFDWYDTSQYDYVREDQSNMIGNTLNFKQELFSYNIGLNNHYKLNDKISFETSINGIASYVKIKDSHLLRDFYTTQNSLAFGYRLGFKANYSINTKNIISLGISKESIRGQKEDMNYYSTSDDKLNSYPATYKNESLSLNVSYKVEF